MPAKNVVGVGGWKELIPCTPRKVWRAIRTSQWGTCSFGIIPSSPVVRIPKGNQSDGGELGGVVFGGGWVGAGAPPARYVRRRSVRNVCLSTPNALLKSVRIGFVERCLQRRKRSRTPPLTHAHASEIVLSPYHDPRSGPASL